MSVGGGSQPGRPLVRPRRVTMAGAMAAIACLLLVVTLFDAMATVRSTDTPVAYRGLLRGLVLVSGALAAAGVVLAVYALRRHRGARIGLSVTAGLLLFSALFVAGPLPVVVAIAAAMLWSREARDWFDGRQPAASSPSSPRSGATPPNPQAEPTTPEPTPAEPTHEPTRDGQPSNPYAVPASNPYAAPASNPYAATASNPYAEPAPAWQQAPHPGDPDPGRPSRPVTVTVAAWLTWVFCSLTAGLFILLVVDMLVQRDELLSVLQRDPSVAQLGWDSRNVIATLWVVSAVAIFWSLAAIALAVLAFRRVQLGRIGLAVSAVVSALAGGIILVGLLNAAAAIAVVVLLFSGRSNAWYAGRPAAPQPRPPVW